jgi:hypothetical protein
MRILKAILVLVMALAVMVPVACGKLASTKGAGPPRDKAACTAYGGRSTAELKLRYGGSIAADPTIRIMVRNTSNLKVGKITLGFPHGVLPVSATVHSGQAVFPLNLRLQHWTATDGEVPLIVHASGTNDQGEPTSAECSMKAKLNKLLSRILDCITQGGSTLYKVAVSAFGSLASWTVSVDDNGIEGGLSVFDEAGTITSPHWPTPDQVRITQIVKVHGGQSLEKPMAYGAQSDVLGRNDSLRLRIEGPGNLECTTTPMSLRPRRP